MKNILILSLILISNLIANGQSENLVWASQLGATTNAFSMSINKDASGNIYTVGNFEGTIDLDPGAGTYNFTNNSGTSQSYIQKLSASGNLIWAKLFSLKSTAYTISTDINRNIYLTGFFSDTVDFDFGSGVSNLMCDTPSFSDAFILKLDSLGNFIWVKQLAGGDQEFISSLKMDPSGDLILTGGFDDTVDFDPGAGVFLLTSSAYGVYQGFVEKLDANGNFIWAKTFADGQYGCNVVGMALDNVGSIYITGSFSSIADFDPGLGTYYLDATLGGNCDAFILKLDNNGTFVWADQLSGGHIQEGFTISLDNAGNIYTSGRFMDTIDLDPGPGIYPVAAVGPYKDAYILKLDNNGAFVWGIGVGNGNGDDWGCTILNDAFGNVYTQFLAGDSVDFDPGPATYRVTGGSGLVIQKLDANGNFIWAKGVANAVCIYRNLMTIDSNNNLYVTGYFGSTVDVDPNAGVFPLTPVGAYDTFIFKWNQVANDVWPGDADANHIVDNTDLLPIGLFYGQTGSPRLVTSNLWQADSCANWGFYESNGADIKHADCNGDGVIDNNDTLAVNLNFNLTHAIITHNNNEAKLNAPDLYFVTNSTSYNAGDIVDVELWAGTSVTPVSNLYGLAFNVNYTASLVQQGTENISYPASWLGTPGTNAIKISNVDPLAVTAYGAETRINHTNASGYGKIADFKFQLNSSISSTSFLNLSISNYVANDSAGVPVVFNTITDSLTINAGSMGISEINNNGMQIYPNPFTNQLTIECNKNKIESIKVTNVLGFEVLQKIFDDRKLTIDLSKEVKGIYFVEVKTEKGIVREKIIKN